MGNLEKIKVWCNENNISYEENIEIGFIKLINKIDYEGFKKAKCIEISMFKIRKIKEEHIDKYLEYIKKELYIFK